MLLFVRILCCGLAYVDQDESTTPIESRYSMKCARSRFFAVPVSFLLAFILPLTCAGQKITTIDPNAASSKSVEDLSNASLSSSQLHADPPELVERAEKKDFTREF